MASVNEYLNMLSGSRTPVTVLVVTAVLGTVLILLLGTLLAVTVSHRRARTARIWDGVFLVFLVIPPTALELIFLLFAGRNRPDTGLFTGMGAQVQADWTVAFVSAIVVSLPLLYRRLRHAIGQVDADTVMAARTLGMPEGRIFRKVILPEIGVGAADGILLSAARFIGEYGAAVLIAADLERRSGTIGEVLQELSLHGSYAAAWLWLGAWYALMRLIVVILHGILRLCRKRRRRHAEGA